eukprot:GHVS01005649.1.p1 GENE.GHVS01005649.1~~GHVS01005649.1.p1  ORF type:complete len:189 (+),score=9.67 GHVS01005649.1:824-1390(+)
MRIEDRSHKPEKAIIILNEQIERLQTLCERHQVAFPFSDEHLKATLLKKLPSQLETLLELNPLFDNWTFQELQKQLRSHKTTYERALQMFDQDVREVNRISTCPMTIEQAEEYGEVAQTMPSEEVIGAVLYAYRSTPHLATGETPSFLMTATELVLPCHQEFLSWVTPEEADEDYISVRNMILTDARK